MKSILLILSAIIPTTIIAKTPQDSTQYTRPFQMTFITPMSTNGMQALETTNNLSINIYAGMSGGLNGIEFGGFVNAIKYNVKGMQFAGFSNIVLGNTEGGQFSGYFNYTGKSLKGVQAAGFANVVLGHLKGVQAAGFANVVLKETEGAQLAGFANTTLKSMEGPQLAGFANVVLGNLKGIQGSGFVNVAVDSVKGAQLAGFANVSANRLEGVQASSFVNYCKTLKGHQIGFINICDSIESGTQLGFLSFSKKGGFRQLELGGSESLYGLLTFKTGTKKLYNIFSAGIRPSSKDFLTGFGYGLGTSFALAPKLDLSLEGIVYNINQLKWYENGYYFLNNINLIAGYHVSETLSIQFGPSFNLLVSDSWGSEGIETTSEVAPWSIYSDKVNDSNVKLYPGGKLSIGYNF